MLNFVIIRIYIMFVLLTNKTSFNIRFNNLFYLRKLIMLT